MSEPLDSTTLRRIAETQRMAARVRKVDLPVVAADSRVGTLVHRARPVATPKGVTCPYCQKRFRPRHHSQKYCDGVCSGQANRAVQRRLRQEARRGG